MKRLSVFVYFVFVLSSAISQVTASDCGTAVNICQDANFAVDPNGFGALDELIVGGISNPAVNPASSNSGCLLAGELNPTWMIVNVAGSGTLEFSFGADNSSGCFDWIMWPYDSSSCNDILLDQLAPVRCNWNGLCEGFTGIGTPLPAGGDSSNFEPELNVLAGEQYLICLSNFSAQTTNVPLNFFGTALISCDAYLPVNINDTTICPGEAAVLTAVANGASSYLWSPGGQTTATIIVNPLVSTTYTCTVTGINNLGNQATGSASATVTVLAVNDTLCGCFIQASNNGPVCAGDSVQLTATSLSGGSYNWFFSGNSVTTDQQFFINDVMPGNYLFTLQGTDSSGNTCNSSTEVTVYSLPTVSSGADTVICAGSTVTLTATGASTYIWTPSGIVNGEAFTPGNTGTYIVTATDTNGCIDSDSIQITVLPIPVASFTAVPSSGVIGTPISFLNLSQNGISYVWDWGNGDSLLVLTLANQTTTFNSPGVYFVTLTASNNICWDTASVWVTIAAPLVQIIEPNVFTPNGDGSNDAWGISTQHMLNLRVLILNRWGNLITELGIDETWNGLVNGKMAEEGVYFYRYEGTDVYGVFHDGHGHFTLVND